MSKLQSAPVAAAVLAGGRGRRMGREKATLPLGGVALALRVAAVAADLADPVVLVAPERHPATTLGMPVVVDPGTGPLAAVAAAFAALKREHVLVLAGDHPAIEPRLLALLVGSRGDGEAVVCEHGGRLQSLVAVYQRAPALAAATALLGAGRRSMRALLDALDVRVVPEPAWRVADPSGRSFIDLDEPGDLRAWTRRPSGR